MEYPKRKKKYLTTFEILLLDPVSSKVDSYVSALLSALTNIII